MLFQQAPKVVLVVLLVHRPAQGDKGLGDLTKSALSKLEEMMTALVITVDSEDLTPVADVLKRL